jgi:hypothetical protein
MSKTCVYLGNRYILRECGETATHVVQFNGKNPRPMCVRHASRFPAFEGYTVEPIVVADTSRDEYLFQRLERSLNLGAKAAGENTADLMQALMRLLRSKE